MSDTQTTNREPPGIADIIARREGALPPDMLRDDPPPDDKGAVPAPKPDAQDDAEAVAERLRRDNEQLRTRATTAEARAAEEARRARDAAAEVQRTRQSAEETNYAAVSNALDAKVAEQQRLQSEITTAGEAGNFARVGEISARLGEIGADISNLRQGKEAYEVDRNTRLRAEPTPRETQPAPTEWTTVGMPREQFLAGRTPATQEWLRNNDQFFTDTKFHKIVTGADQIAQGRGFTPDTPAYFRFIEEQAGMTTAASKPQSRDSSAPPSAPPSRDAPTPTGRNAGRPGDIYVTPEQKRVADWLGVDPVDYAKDEAELRARGELPHRRR